MCRVSAFPDVRWGSQSSVLRAPLVAFSCTRVGSRLIRTMTPLDRRLLQRSHGRYTILGPFAAPIMLLTTTGARSGLARTTPLLYARDGESLVVAGSNFGQDHHPAWSGNLLAAPYAVVTIGGQQVPVVARLLEGAEAQEGYGRLEEVARTYTEYRSRTSRRIRVFRLTANG
jgi:deazaflavin-dependent oxidoreductase (nitroreductase family)